LKQNIVESNMSIEEGRENDLENIKESLKVGLLDARQKVTFLRNELKEKQKSLDRERDMRERAEHELTNISLNRPPTHPTPSSPHMRRQNMSFNGHKNIDGMVDELNSAKMLNRSLTSKLSQAEKDIEILKQSKEDMKLEMEAASAARGAMLVEKIYRAQKEREAAILNQSKLLSEEKQELLNRLKLKDQDHGFDSGVDTGSIFGEEIFNNPNQLHLGNNGSRAIEFHGDVIIDRLNTAQSSNKRKSVEELKRLKDERDTSRNLVERLQQELKALQHEQEMTESQHRKNEKNSLKAMQNQLKTVMSERDEALAKVSHLLDELEQLKIQQSLKNSLSQEKHLRDQFNTTLDEFETKLSDKDIEINRFQHSYDEQTSKLNNTIREKNAMAEQLRDLLQQAKEDKEKAERSERLVAVMRRHRTKSISETLS